MSIDTFIEALQEAKSRGITDQISIVLNTENLCSVDVIEITVSSLTGVMIYAEGCDKNYLGYLKQRNDNKQKI